MATYNFPDHISGDTFYGVTFVLTNSGGPIDLTDCDIYFKIQRFPAKDLLSTDNGGIAITDATNGKFEVAEQIISWKPYMYHYKIYVVFPSGDVVTYLQGTWRIENGYS